MSGSDRSTLHLSMKIVNLEGQIKAALTQIGALRQALSCAICAQCSDLLGDEDFMVDDEGRLIHERCQ